MKIRILNPWEAARIESVRLYTGEPKYNAEFARMVINKFYGQFPELDKKACEYAKERHWEIDIRHFAKRFIQMVDQKNIAGILYIYYLFEECNYHQANRHFLNGWATDYIK